MSKFNLKIYEQMVRDVLDRHFDKINAVRDAEELLAATQLKGEAPAGYHVMENGGLMLDAEMPNGNVAAENTQL